MKSLRLFLIEMLAFTSCNPGQPSHIENNIDVITEVKNEKDSVLPYSYLSSTPDANYNLRKFENAALTVDVRTLKNKEGKDINPWQMVHVEVCEQAGFGIFGQFIAERSGRHFKIDSLALAAETIFFPNNKIIEIDKIEETKGKEGVNYTVFLKLVNNEKDRMSPKKIAVNKKIARNTPMDLHLKIDLGEGGFEDYDCKSTSINVMAISDKICTANLTY